MGGSLGSLFLDDITILLLKAAADNLISYLKYYPKLALVAILFC